MMHLLLKPASICLLVMFFQGCHINPRADLARFGRFVEPTAEEETISREKAMEFVRFAQIGDVEQMLRITSPLSHTKAPDTIRTLYAEQVIPEFKDTVVTWKPRGKPSRDENNNPGIGFSGDARGKKSFSFRVTVAKENGIYVVINIAKGH